MKLSSCALLLLLVAVGAAAGAAAEKERANKSAAAGGLLWATGKDENDLLTAIDSDDPSAVEDDASDEFAGGFSSLDSMLQWAIGKLIHPSSLLHLGIKTEYKW